LKPLAVTEAPPIDVIFPFKVAVVSPIEVAEGIATVGIATTDGVGVVDVQAEVVNVLSEVVAVPPAFVAKAR
jgi:hypothetical protein